MSRNGNKTVLNDASEEDSAGSFQHKKKWTDGALSSYHSSLNLLLMLLACIYMV